MAVKDSADDIAGLIERLRLISGIMKSSLAKSAPMQVWQVDPATMDEAATQLAALSAENAELKARLNEMTKPEEEREWLTSATIDKMQNRAAALSARVKELEGQLSDAEATMIRLNSGQELQSLMRLSNDLEARAETAERSAAELEDELFNARQASLIKGVALFETERERDQAREALKLGLDLISEEKGWGTYPRMEGSEIYTDAEVFKEFAIKAMS